tara:strand:+ start:2741 stop:3808 length:1068 start_codon:yes stop_codon:yes gene_type:complete
MTGVIRLPVAPRPFRDELLSSWMARVATRYGLEVPELVSYLVGQGNSLPALRQIDDATPDQEQLKIWSRGCRIDPARLERLSLKLRYPNRSRDWVLARTRGGISVCLACFDADVAEGRDAYIRADWRLAERVVCPVHKEMLRDRCLECGAHLRASFRLRTGLLRVFCAKCECLLTGRGGARADRMDAAFTKGILTYQSQAERIINSGEDQLAHLEWTIRTLWAPLDRVGAARPVLALWFDQEGWNCPFEARSAVGAPAPLQHLSVRWRVLTLVILSDLFGEAMVPMGTMPEAAARLFRRAAPIPRAPYGRREAIGKGVDPIDIVRRRVQRLSKNLVHRWNGNFEGETADLGRVRP